MTRVRELAPCGCKQDDDGDDGGDEDDDDDDDDDEDDDDDDDGDDDDEDDDRGLLSCSFGLHHLFLCLMVVCGGSAQFFGTASGALNIISLFCTPPSSKTTWEAISFSSVLNF